MTISRVGTDVANKGTSASATANYPSGILAGDIIVVTLGAFGTGAAPPTFTTPSGYSLLGGQTSQGSKLRSAHYWKIASGSEGSSLSIAISSGSGWAITVGARRSTIAFGASSINSFSQATSSALTLATPALTGVPVGAWSQSAAVFAATDTNGATITGNGWSSDATASVVGAGASSASNSTRNGSVPQCSHVVSGTAVTFLGCSYYLTESNDTSVAAASSIAVTSSAALTKPAAALAATATIAITSSAALTKPAAVLAATASIAITSSALLTKPAAALVASSSITFLSTAQLTTLQPIAASSLITIQSTADLTVGAGLAASSLITIVSSGGLGAQGAQLAATALINFTSSADLTVGVLLSASASITFQSTATLTAVGADLVASAVITFQSTADLTTHAAGAVLVASALITISSSASLTTTPLVTEVPRRGERRIRFHAATDAIAQPKQARVQVQAHAVRLSYQKLYVDADPGVLQASVEVGGSASTVTVSTCDVDAYPQAAHVDTSASTVTVRTVKNLTDEELLAVSIAARRRKRK